MENHNLSFSNIGHCYNKIKYLQVGLKGVCSYMAIIIIRQASCPGTKNKNRREQNKKKTTINDHIFLKMEREENM